MITPKKKKNKLSALRYCKPKKKEYHPPALPVAKLKTKVAEEYISPLSSISASTLKSLTDILVSRHLRLLENILRIRS